MKIIKFERTEAYFKYTVSAKEGHSVEVVYRRRAFGTPSAEGGAVAGWSRSEEVQAFREASDWLSRFLHKDGSPRQGDAMFSGLDVAPVEEKA